MENIFGIKASKTINDYNHVTETLDGLLAQFKFRKIVVIRGVVSSNAAIRWAESKGIECEIISTPSETRGKGSDFVVNTTLANKCTTLVVFYNIYDNNIRHFVNYCEKNKKPVYKFKYHG